eukprot:NODE_36_length_31474_cov_0.342438.p12 type:complete len:295 gc:universal NODE_36_length_31474_cov_0.342438:10530-9646(-)
MLVAVVGCVHGDMKRIYNSIADLESKFKRRIDLILFTGDLQTARTVKDLESMAVPDKYKKLGDFRDYFVGKYKIPKLTIAIGGNHECSEYLMDYPSGGFLIPNFYYMGYCSIIKAKGITIAGWSGIYKDHNFDKPRNEVLPLSEGSKRSIYHCRRTEYEKLNSFSEKVDICLSHDWPGGIAYYGNTKKIFKDRPWFKRDIENSELGNPYAFKLLQSFNPKFWVSSHMHYKFTCQVGILGLQKSSTEFKDPNVLNHPSYTTFIALDKPKGDRLDFLELIEIENDEYSEELQVLLK